MAQPSGQWLQGQQMPRMGELRKLASRLAACCLANNVPDNLRAGASYHSGVQADLRQRLRSAGAFSCAMLSCLTGLAGRSPPTGGSTCSCSTLSSW